MIPWQQFPFVRILLFYVLGIFLNLFFQFEIPSFVILFLFFSFFILNVFLKRKTIGYQKRFVAGILIGVLLILIGIYNNHFYLNKGIPIHVSSQKSSYFFLLTEQPTETEKSMKAIGQVFSTDKKHITKSTKAILYFAKDTLSHHLNYGDLLKLNVHLNEVNPPKNPHEFNFKRYLANRRIYLQAYVSSRSWSFLSHNQANPIKSFGIHCRTYLMKCLKSTSLFPSEFSVAAAILLGQDEILDDETRQDYAGAGAMHVLCVSGLHVGIIYLAFNLMFGFLKRNRFQKRLKAFLLILVVWSYALITSFSPSVLRASVMLSFIILGESLNKKGNIYNSIAASAFLLLLLNPAMIMEVGFQLSYAAVVGIVSIYPLMKKHLTHKNTLIDKILSVLIVSIAAQIGTFPLAIYYFHQFPVYFLLTNLVVIFLATLIINFGFLFLLIASVPLVSSVFIFVFGLLVKSMNTYVSWIESLPGSTIKSLILNPLEIILLYLLIISITQCLLRKSKSWFVISTGLIFILGIGFSYRNYSRLRQQKFIVYAIPKSSVYEFQQGKNSTVFMDSTILENNQKINYHLSPNWIYSGIRKPKLVHHSEQKYQRLEMGLIKNEYFISFKNHIFLSINSKNSAAIKKLKTIVDYVIISNNASVSLVEIHQNLNPKLIILDSSNSIYFEREITAEALKNSIPLYSVINEGVLTIRFD